MQADARRRRQGVGHLDLHVHAHRAQRVEQPLLAANQQNLLVHAELVFAHHPHAVLQRIGLQPRAAFLQPVQARQLPAFDPCVGIDMVRLADADVVIDRRAGKTVAQRRQQLRLLILPPLRQMALLRSKRQRWSPWVRVSPCSSSVSVGGTPCAGGGAGCSARGTRH